MTEYIRLPPLYKDSLNQSAASTQALPFLGGTPSPLPLEVHVIP